MELGREEIMLLGRLVVATEKSATANERLIELATEERDAGESILGPPLCPHCGTLNPSIRVKNGESGGQLANYVLLAQCDNCSNVFFGAPQGWLMFKSQDEYETFREGRDST